MRLLLHSCCGPCVTFPQAFFRAQGFLVTGFFYNPNIFPDEEEKKRWTTYCQYASLAGFPCMWKKEKHGVFLDAVGSNLEKPKRCLLCYEMRLSATAKTAKELGFDCFSTTLLVSPYQNHDYIIEVMSKVSKTYDVPFVYRDFRVGYKRSREMARGCHLYMQKYCGCEFSLREDLNGGDEVNARPT